MYDKETDKKPKIGKAGAPVDYSRDEIESLLPNLAEELAGTQKNPLDIAQTHLEKTPRSPEEVKEAVQSHYESESELFLPKTEDFLRRCSTLAQAEVIIDYQLKIQEITKEQADELRELCKKHGVRYFGQKKEWGYYEKTYRNKRDSV